MTSFWPGPLFRVGTGWGAGLFCALLLAGASGRASEPPVVTVYGGYGHPGYFMVWGRVLEDDEAPEPHPHRGAIRNAISNLRTLESDEIADAAVRITLQGRTYTATTDAEGIFVVERQVAAPTLQPGPHTVMATAPELPGSPTGEGVVYITGSAPGIVMVSDIDDTVLQTGVRNKLRMAIDVLTRNAAQLAPVPGAPEAYRTAVTDDTLTVYLSGSPINFFNRLQHFLRRWRFPAGPLLLKNFGEGSLRDQQGYKGTQLAKLMATFPQHCFVLIGDSGEQDPEIYMAARERSSRVGAIVIRQVVGDTDDARLAPVIRVPNFLPPFDLGRVVREACLQALP